MAVSALIRDIDEVKRSFLPDPSAANMNYM